MLKLLASKRSQVFTRKYVKILDVHKDNELDQVLKDLTIYDLAKMFKNAMDIVL